VTSQADIHWRIPVGQRLLFEDFDDGIVAFDTLVGSTHLLDVTAAEALAIIEAEPGLSAQVIHARLLSHLDIAAESLPLAAVDELLWRLEDLNLIAGFIE
jgi:PqqD family protein of HPr-rel-A system